MKDTAGRERRAAAAVEYALSEIERVREILRLLAISIMPLDTDAASAAAGSTTLVLDREEAYALRMGLRDLLEGQDGTHHQPCACLICETARTLLDRIPPAAAESAEASGEGRA